LTLYNTTTRQRHVLICGINFAPEPIGVGQYSGELSSYLCAQGDAVDVVTAVPHYPGWKIVPGYANRYMQETIAGAKVLRTPLRLTANTKGLSRLMVPLSFALFSAPVVIWQILTKRPATVLCVEPSLLSAPAALIAAKLIGARTVLHVQDLEIDAAFAVGHLRGGLLRSLAFKFEKWLLSGFDCIVTISAAMAQKIEEKAIPPQRIRIVRNWVNLDFIYPKAETNSYRNELGIQPGARVVQYSGNMGVKQALHIVLEAAERLKDRTDIVFVIAGEGPEKAPLLEKFGHLANVRFLALQPMDRLCEFLNLADLHVLPQDRNAADLVLPSKLGGMLASGRPIVAMADADTELGRFLEGAATVIPPGDVDRLTAAIVAHANGPAPVVDKASALTLELDYHKCLPQLRSILFPAEAHGDFSEPQP